MVDMNTKYYGVDDFVSLYYTDERIATFQQQIRLSSTGNNMMLIYSHA